MQNIYIYIYTYAVASKSLRSFLKIPDFQYDLRLLDTIVYVFKLEINNMF